MLHLDEAPLHKRDTDCSLSDNHADIELIEKQTSAM